MVFETWKLQLFTIVNVWENYSFHPLSLHDLRNGRHTCWMNGTWPFSNLRSNNPIMLMVFRQIKVQGSISGKKNLTVLDDVWKEDDTKWEPLKNSLKRSGVGSKILVTTRNERVAIPMGTFKNEILNLGHLSHKECGLLLGRIALHGKDKEECEKFRDIGKRIANKCKGLPLAAKTLEVFCVSRIQWESVLNSEIWKLEEIRNRVNLARGVENEILKLSDELSTVRNVLDDAEKKGYKDKSVKDWLRRLEDMSYEMDDVLDEWNISIIKLHKREQKVWSLIQSPSLFFKKAITRHDIALKIKQVKARLDLIVVEKDRFGFVASQPADHSFESRRVQSTSLIDLEEICGRDLEREDLVRKLVGEGGIEEDLGVGTTTLAKLAYNDSRVENCFELRIWICVSDPFDEVEIAKGIVESVKREKCPNNNRLEMVLQFLKVSISGKKFLLILDDVWTEDYTKWESLKTCLKCGGAGSKILVTTRNKRVALMMGTVENEIHHLGHLSHEDCWLLLSRIAFFGKNKEECEKFHNIGKNIAKKCNGLPLAARALGSLLRFKNTLEDWETVLHSEIWELEEVEVDLFPHLLMSYNELSPILKRCFSYCAVFPKDTLIGVESLIRRWMAMGYLGSSRSNGETDDWKARGREYFDKLATRSLFQDFVKCDLHEQIDSFRMHDIIHDFARFLIKKNGGLMKKIRNVA
ncbi:hypothetical protein MIMGU_mgv1a022174mg [Erythranthe guttata]|uniref:NB-ARC domain-containing protein n=1 Tax=Erythranthe guttata TaxID=4155 RepID=A0A022Q2M3_ERYGU|nr:hypothetical protein MIMGU_mgv1a022174mg [Erythranthe guttata]